MNAAGNDKRKLTRCVRLNPDHTTIQKGHFCPVCQGTVPGLNRFIGTGKGMPDDVLVWRKEKHSSPDDAVPEPEHSALTTDQSLKPKPARAQKSGAFLSVSDIAQGTA